MKKFNLIFLFLFLINTVAYSETVGQRLDKIEKRLGKIEESLDGSKFLQELIGGETELNSNSTPPVTKLGFKLNGLFCSDGSLFEKINVGYLITNNYDQEVKLIDGFFVAKDLFGDEVFKAKIGRGVYLKPGKSKNIEGDVSEGLLGESCAKIKQSRLPDLTVELHVSKIAFGDNSVVVFNDENNKKSSSEKKLFEPKNIISLDSLSPEEEKVKLTIMDDIYEMSKQYIYGCWSVPLGLPKDEDLSFTIELELNPDGKIKKASYSNKDIKRMSEPGQGFFKVLAESGMRAVRLCQPYKFPPDKYSYWKKLTYNFDASALYN